MIYIDRDHGLWSRTVAYYSKKILVSRGRPGAGKEELHITVVFRSWSITDTVIYFLAFLKMVMKCRQNHHQKQGQLTPYDSYQPVYVSIHKSP